LKLNEFIESKYGLKLSHGLILNILEDIIDMSIPIVDNLNKVIVGLVKKDKEIVKLKLSHCKFLFFPKIVFRLESLESLNLNNSVFKKIPDQFDTLENLKELNIGSIGVFKFKSTSEIMGVHDGEYKIIRGIGENIPYSIGKLKNLKRLYIYGLSLKSFPEQYINLQSLEELDLSSNKLKSLPNEFINLKNLNELYLDYNFFEEIPEPIFYLKKLEILDLSNNKIRKLSEKFPNLQNHSRTDFQTQIS